MTKLTVRAERWPIRGTFTISRGSKTTADIVLVELEQNGYRGRGECVPYGRYGESIEQVLAAIESLRSDLANGLDRHGLQQALPSGAARNALDCAFWDLEAKSTNTRAWNLAGISSPQPQLTAYTLSLDTPERMRAVAESMQAMPLLKLKLSGPDDLARVRAVHQGAPNARLIIDANEAWTIDDYLHLTPKLHELGVEMIEQPLPADADDELSKVPHPVAVCADETCHDSDSIPDILGKYDMINVKLDKTGGLTEALKLIDLATEHQLGVMTGCMVATSLAMAPAFIAAQKSTIVDLDGPLLLAKDRPHGLIIENGIAQEPHAELWG